RHAEQARDHDAGERNTQRVRHADAKRAQVAVPRAEVEHELADVEAGRILQEAEAGSDLARLEVGGDVLPEPDEHEHDDQRQPAPHQPSAPATGALACAPRGVADGGPVHAACVAMPAINGWAARTSGHPWSTGC